ncbi:hypothetical protein LGL00_26605, partial [Clostridium estertheticum]
PNLGEQLNQFKNGVLFTGLFMGGAKALETAAPWIKKGASKVMDNIEKNVNKFGKYIDDLVPAKAVTPDGKIVYIKNGPMKSGGGEKKVELNKQQKDYNKAVEESKNGKGVSAKWHTYFNDIEANTGRTLTQEQKGLVIKEINSNPHNEKLIGQDYKNHRAAFNNQKESLISEWEKKTGQTWPTYENDVLSKNGKAYIKSGDKYDAHEIIPNVYDSSLEWWNLHPAARPGQHQGGIHGVDSSIKDIFK